MYTVTYEVLDNSESSQKKIVYCEEALFFDETPMSYDGVQQEMGRSDFQCITVNSQDKEIMGYAILYSTSTFIEVARFGVLPKYQGIGIGINFMRHLRDMFPSKPFNLTVRKSNTPAISLYRKVGFRTVGLVDLKDDTYLTMYW